MALEKNVKADLVKQFGKDVKAACGQLRAELSENKN